MVLRYGNNGWVVSVSDAGCLTSGCKVGRRRKIAMGNGQRDMGATDTGETGNG